MADAPLKIIIAPDPVLKAVAAPIQTITDETRKFLDDMLATMYAARGVGLAAPQVGVSQRVLVIDPVREEGPHHLISKTEEHVNSRKAASGGAQPMSFINPEIIWRSEEPNVFEEGCLSLPDFYAEIERPASIRVKYLDRDAKEHELLADGFLATVLQHEIDHLNGVLLLDYVSKLKRDMAIKKFTKMKRGDEIL